MLAIIITTENGQRHLRPSAAELTALVQRIGSGDDRFLVVRQIPDLPDVFVQVWHESEGDYTLEHRDGDPQCQYQTRLAGPGAVAVAMAGWARREPDWDAGLSWTEVELGPVPDPVPPLVLDEGDREQLEERIREVLVGGYATRAELTELAEDHLVSGEHRPVSRAQARHLVDRLWLERVAEQSGWVGETGPERLTRAFCALEAAGLTAREHFTCCHSCGQAEIGDAGSPTARGFVYFHSQSTDAAAAGRGLTLHYGGFDSSAETTTAVGREVAAALAQVGLPVAWNGDPHRAIEVKPLEWRRRLVG
ncbi:hypothetical protein OG455_32545 [Kitasatospora sp. NBC_01287]|uniref:DUF6891 domain-containing protein n=1 Tax=Kitasatospora sp. NBC_01287 TaxID=2903573 RepID=UPI00225987EF|nr:hypothetical protein [Kitasatospora sp. NBC_01287]MCX4750187.1 hypothetical protein [Kitasatospora sp. NBC_01287]